MFAKDALPATPALGYCEYFFTRRGGDLGFDPAETVTASDLARLRARNMIQQATLQDIDAGVQPDRMAAQPLPGRISARASTSATKASTSSPAGRTNAAKFKLPDGRMVKAGDPVVTYVARSLEPYRGFPQFMRAAAEIARRRKDAIFIVAGDDTVSYGRLPPHGRSWRQAMLAETGIHPLKDRVPRQHRPQRAHPALPGLGGARLPDRAVRAVVVDAGGDGVRLPDRRLAHRPGQRSDRGRAQRPPDAVLRNGRAGGAAYRRARPAEGARGATPAGARNDRGHAIGGATASASRWR